MKPFSTFAGLILCLPTLTSAGLLDEIETLQPVNNWISSLELSDECGSTGCGDCCTSTSVCDPRIPMMMGDGGLGVPTSLLFQFQNHMTKVSENNSVIPQDRIGLSWNLLNDVETRSGLGGFVPGDDQDLSEFKLRYEKTFFDGNFSVDVIMPFNITTERDQSFSAFNDLTLDRESELGDLAINLKALLHRTNRFALSAGLMLEFPTSDPQQILVPIGPGFGLQFDNEESYFLTPWIGHWYLHKFDHSLN